MQKCLSASRLLLFTPADHRETCSQEFTRSQAPDWTLSWVVKIIGYFSYFNFKASFNTQPVGDPVVCGEHGVQHYLSFLTLTGHVLRLSCPQGVKPAQQCEYWQITPTLRAQSENIWDIFTVRLGTVIPAASVLHFSKFETSSGAFCPKWLLLHPVNITTFDSTHTDPLGGHTATCPFMLSTTFPLLLRCYEWPLH